MIANRFWKYAVVGLQISAIYWVLVFALTESLHFWYMASTIITAIILTVIGFIFNSIWTWRGRGKRENNTANTLKLITNNWQHPSTITKTLWQSNFFRYCLVGGCGTLIGWLQVYIYTEYFGFHYMLSSILGTAIVLITTFIVKDRWIWKTAND